MKIRPATTCRDLPPSSILVLLPQMPDARRHRGPHPEDGERFARAWEERLRGAVGDLSWLLSRGYASPSALKVVGDRYDLTARQRTAVMRCACTDAACADRRAREVGLDGVAGRRVWIDGYNVLTTVEAALAGGVVIVGRDGCWRDMASMHGTWRRVEETGPAVVRVGELLGAASVGEVTWYLDSPVSNSGRLKGAIEEIGRERGWGWRVELVMDPDKVLAVAGRDAVVATADSGILDRCGAWVALAREVVRGVPGVWLLDLGGE
jgi:hypothetical protein